MRSLLLLITVCAAGACAPVFSDFQNADLVGHGNLEVTPSFSSVVFMEDGDSDHLQYNVGLTGATGIGDRVDLRGGLGAVIPDFDDATPIFVAGMGPKIRIGGERAAVYLPIGFAFGVDIDNPEDTFAWHPTLLVTGDIGHFIEFTPSIKALIPLTDRDAESGVAFNLGLGIGRDRSRFAVRPEVGVMFNPGESGVFWAAGVGLSFGRRD